MDLTGDDEHMDMSALGFIPVCDNGRVVGYLHSPEAAKKRKHELLSGFIPLYADGVAVGYLSKSKEADEKLPPKKKQCARDHQRDGEDEAKKKCRDEEVDMSVLGFIPLCSEGMVVGYLFRPEEAEAKMPPKKRPSQ